MDIPENILRHIRGEECTRDSLGLSGAGIFLYRDFVLKVQPMGAEAEREAEALSWLKGKVRVPEIIENETVGSLSVLLMERLYGKNLSSPSFLSDPQLLFEKASEALETLWKIEADTIPFSSDISVHLQEARKRVEAGLVSPSDIDSSYTSLSPQEILSFLEDNRVEEDSVFSHGDLSLPNVMVLPGGEIAFLDLGRSGKGSKWNDISILLRSLESNFSGRYNGGKKYGGFSVDRLFDILGIEEDKEKIHYYRMMDELF